ncbi:hypothetical protein PHMEG_00032328, partial [Phytophthora megakarya]
MGNISSTVLEAVENVRRRSSTSFRPTLLEKQINDAITHPDNVGKDPQCLLEYAQQARENSFRRTPPVLRGAYDFGFHVRGLSVTYFASFTSNMMMETLGDIMNMADFSRKNSLPPAPNMPTYPGLLDSRAIWYILDFIEAFGEGEIPDNDTTRRLVLWLDMKLGKFRGLVLASGLSAAIQVKNELSLHDSQLSRLLYDQQKSRMAELLGKLNEKPFISSTGPSDHRESRSDSQGGVPKSV